jgi:hypothetical protein
MYSLAMSRRTYEVAPEFHLNLHDACAVHSQASCRPIVKTRFSTKDNQEYCTCRGAETSKANIERAPKGTQQSLDKSVDTTTDRMSEAPQDTPMERFRLIRASTMKGLGMGKKHML